jgi:hypothetical protein
MKSNPKQFDGSCSSMSPEQLLGIRLRAESMGDIFLKVKPRWRDHLLYDELFKNVRTPDLLQASKIKGVRDRAAAIAVLRSPY